MPDHDPFENFKTTMNTGMSTDLHPLPASEVRRRGDRLRRRNTALAAVGGTAAALVAIGVPVALSQSGPETESDPGLYATQGTDPEAVQWRTEIPADFPILFGMPKAQPGFPIDVREEYESQAVGPCAGPAWDVSSALDSLQAIYTDPTEGGQDRVLAVFADDAAATAQVDVLQELVDTCRAQGQPQVTAQALTSDLGEQSVVFVNVYQETGDAILHLAVRVGNAVLYSTSTFLGAGDAEVLEYSRELAQERSAAVVSEMCVFSADPC